MTKPIRKTIAKILLIVFFLQFAVFEGQAKADEEGTKTIKTFGEYLLDMERKGKEEVDEVGDEETLPGEDLNTVSTEESSNEENEWLQCMTEENEVISERNYYQKIYNLPDGTHLAKLSLEPMHYYEDGVLKDIDLNIKEINSSDGYQLGVEKNNLKMYFQQLDMNKYKVKKVFESISYEMIYEGVVQNSVVEATEAEIPKDSGLEIDHTNNEINVRKNDNTMSNNFLVDSNRVIEEIKLPGYHSAMETESEVPRSDSTQEYFIKVRYQLLVPENISVENIDTKTIQFTDSNSGLKLNLQMGLKHNEDASFEEIQNKEELFQTATLEKNEENNNVYLDTYIPPSLAGGTEAVITLSDSSNFYPTADTTIKEGWSSNGWSWDNIRSGYDYSAPTWSLIKFNPSSLPDNAEINYASAYLYKYKHQGSDGSNGRSIDAYRIIQDWNSSVTYSNKPNKHTSRESRKYITSNQFYSWTVTYAVKNWFSYPSSNHGLYFLPAYAHPNNLKFFYSSEKSGSSYDPYMVINYSVPNENPNPPAGINGNNTCVVNQYCTYQVQGDDPDTNDKLKFKIDYQNGETNWTSSYVDENTWSQSLSIKWTTTGTKDLKAKAMDDDGADSVWSGYLKRVTVVDDNTPPSPPSDITGPYTCPLDEYCSYRVRGYDPDTNDQLKFRIDYEDGVTSWTESFVDEYTWSPDLSIKWTTPGFKDLKAQAMDDDGGLSYWSSTKLTVEVEEVNQPPVAHAGNDQTVQIVQGQTSIWVTLDGIQSYDPDGDAIDAYDWGTTTPGAPVPDSHLYPQVNLQADGQNSKTYIFTLRVQDSQGNWSNNTDEVQITVNPTAPAPEPDIDVNPNQLEFEIEEDEEIIAASSVSFFQNEDSFINATLVPDSYSVETLDNDEQIIQINDEDFAETDSPGDPILPYKIYSFVVPANTDFESINLEILSKNERVLDGEYVIKAASPMATWDDENSQVLFDWGEGKEIVNGKNINVYNQNSYHPTNVIEINKTSQMRKWKFVRLVFYPMQYNPVTKKINLIEETQIKLHFNLLSMSDEELNAILSDTVMDEEAGERADNYDFTVKEWYTPSEMIATAEEVAATYDYVIITTNAIRDNSDILDDFVTHKSNRGFDVLIVTEDDYGSLTGPAPDGRAEKIREWLQDNYEDMGIRYVLLIGNPDPDDPSAPGDSVGDLPMKMCWPRNGATTHVNYLNSPTDYFYADLTGNWDLDGDEYYGEYSEDRGATGVDFDPEVYVGRIPVYNDDYNMLDSILQKTIDYETDTGNKDWRKKTLLATYPLSEGTPGWRWGEAVKNDILIPANLLNYFRIYNEDYGLNPPPEMTPTNGDNLLAEWQNHYGLVVWFTHGGQTTANMMFSSSRTQFLEDTHPSFTFQASCNNAWPENDNNLAYSILENGGVSTIGATRVSWYSSGATAFRNTSSLQGLSYHYTEEIIKGQSTGESLYKVTNNPNLNQNRSTRWMNYMDFNVYGDPSVFLWPKNKKQVVIKNTGEATLTVSNITKQLNRPWLTVIPPSSYPLDIAPGESIVIDVTVDNDSLSQGTYSDRLIISSNDPDENPYPDGVDISLRIIEPVLADLDPPATLNHSPAKDATEVSSSENISVEVIDEGEGVDQNSLSLQVDHQDGNGYVDILTNGTAQGSYVVDITSIIDGYIIEYNPENDLPYSQQIGVKIDAKDLANNIMAQESYSFTVEDDPNPPPPPPPPPPSDPLVSFYEFNEFDGNTAIDSVNALNGEMRGGATRNVSGKEGKSLLLDGLDDYVYVYDNAVQSITGSELSFGAWVNPDTMSDGGWIMTKGTTACWTTQSYQMWLSSDNKVGARLQFSDNTEVTLTGETVLSAGEWYHIFVTYDGSEARIYVNGEEDKVVSASGNIQDSALGLFIGAWSFATDEQNPAPRKFFHGEIDSVRIYEQVMTAEEIIALYEGIVTPKSDPILHYTFNEGSGEIANDISGMGNHGTIVGAAWDQEGLSGSTLDFDGVDDYVNAGVRDNLQFGSEESFSIETWIKPEASGEYQHIAGDGYATHRLGLLNGKFDIRLGQNNLIVTGDTEIERNIWSHVVAVYDSATKTARLYVNGEEIKTGSNDSVSWPSGDRPFSVGNTIGEMYYFAGLMDELRVYNQVLEATEILIHYNAEKPVSNDPPPPPPRGKVGYWKFDEGSGIYANDASENGYTGQINGATWDPKGVTGSTLNFNGEDSMVDVGIKRQLQFGSEEAFSMETWIKPTNRPIYQHLAGDGYLTYRLGLWEGKIDLRLGLNNLVVTGDDPVALNEWSHVVATYDPATKTVRLYVNGTEVKNGNNAALSWESGDRPFSIGNTIGEYYHFTGAIDEVRVYNEVLDASTVSQHYQSEKPASIPPPAPGKVADWKFDEGSGTVAGDSEGNNNGQIDGATWEAEGVLNTALTFDGTDDSIDMGIKSDLQYGSEDSFTIETWVKPSGTKEYAHLAGDGYLTYRMGLLNGKPDIRLGLNALVVTADEALPLNYWSSYVASYDGETKTAKLYVNGVEIKSVSNGSLNWSSGDRPFSIGNTIGEYYYFDGSIDEVRVYNTVLDPAEIMQHYIDENPQMGPPTPSLTVGDWKFDETSGGTAADSSEYGHEGTVHGAVFGVGKINNGLTFDGEDDYIDMGVESRLGFSSTDNFTIAMWLKPDAFTEYQHLAGDGFLTYRLGINNGNLDLRVGMNSLIVTADEPLQLNQWNFVTGVYDASTKTIKLYLNGVEIKSGTNGSLDWISDIRPFTIGQTIGEGYNYWGIMDEVGVYHEALSAEEVMTLFNQ